MKQISCSADALKILGGARRPDARRRARQQTSHSPQTGEQARAQREAWEARRREEREATTAEARARPQAPPARHHEHAPPGREAIDELTVAEASISPFQMREKLTPQDGERFAQAWGTVSRWIQEAQTELDHERALKWRAALPQLLFRQVGSSRGGSRGRSAAECYRIRLDAFLTGNEGALVQWLRRDLSELPPRPGEADPVRRALNWFAKGEVSKALNHLRSHGMGNLADARILAQLAAKHPKRRRPVPAAPEDYGVDDTPLVKLDLDSALRSLRRNKAAGPDGMRNEYLMSLLFCNRYVHPDARAARERETWFGEMFLNDRLPLWFNHAMLAVSLVAPCKEAPPERPGPDYVPDVRPVGMGSACVKLWLKALWEQFKDAAIEYLTPLQLGVGVKAGIDIAITKIRLLLEQHPDWVLMSLDIKNMFNEICRKGGIQAFADVPSLRPLVRTLLVLLGPEAHLVVGGRIMQEATWKRISGLNLLVRKLDLLCDL